jgi:Flp pilus assembly protein TadD
MLERRGRGADAVAIYDSALASNKGDVDLLAARARAAAHKPAPPAPSLRTSAAAALIAPATALLIEKQEEIALAYLRLALRLDPTRDDAWMLVGDILASDADAVSARAAYAKVRPGSSQYLAARTKLAWSYQEAGDKDLALSTARETLAHAAGDRDATVTLADLLRADEHYDESAKVLDALIAAGADQTDWRLLYMRAVDLEESNHWVDAERDLQAALKQRPDEPELLNFLGYSWIDRGVRLPEAMAMVQKAVSLQPQSGAMIDSLGWGYYRLGNYPAAVEKLEAAIVLEPGDPDVNDHLGDAYWRVGRKIEADFQWRRVLSLDPTAKLKAEVEAKLASGLSPVATPSVVAVE